MIQRLISAVSEVFPLDDSLHLLERLIPLDRFQASAGIMTAADLIAEILNEYGFNVKIHCYSDPSQWWTFKGPASWTPNGAELVVVGESRRVIVRYPDDRMCLATYSAPTNGPRIQAPLRAFDAL